MEDNELVYQIGHLRFAEWRENVIDKDDPQMPVEKRRHLVDTLCYILLDKPRFIGRRPQPEPEPGQSPGHPFTQ
jgi:hypothetical protein